MTLLHELAVRAVEEGVVERLEASLGSMKTIPIGDAVSVPISMAIGEFLGLSGLLVVSSVRFVEGSKESGDSEGAVDFRIFRGEVGLVEIVGVGHVSAMNG